MLYNIKTRRMRRNQRDISLVPIVFIYIFVISHYKIIDRHDTSN